VADCPLSKARGPCLLLNRDERRGVGLEPRAGGVGEGVSPVHATLEVATRAFRGGVAST